MSQELNFDEISHEYRLSGVRLPHVTGVMEEMGLIPDYPIGPYRVRGQRVHQATVLFDEGVLDQYDIGADLVPYVDRYKNLVGELSPEYELIERAMYHPVHCYAGIVDRSGRVFWKRFVADIKTGKTGDETGLQLAAYAMMVDPVGYRDIVRYKFDLSEGDGKLVKYTDSSDFEAWVSLLNVFKWKMARKSRRASA